MRDLLILGGIVILSMAAWTVTLDAVAEGHGGHGSHGHGGLEGHMRHGEGRARHVGIFFPTQYETQPYLFHGEPEPGPAPPEMLTGGLVVGGPEHIEAGHLAGSAIHPLARVPLRVEGREAVIPQPTTPSAAESDQEGAATAQPNPTVSPWSPRPPGAAGPGRRVSGWPSPGLAGPGRPASPRW